MNPDRALALALAACLGLSGCDAMPSWMGGEKPKREKLEGERLKVLPEERALQPDEALQAMPVNMPPPQENENWAQPADAAAAASANLALDGLLESLSSAGIGEGEDFGHTLVPRPVVAGGMVFAMDAAGTVSAHDAGDITQTRWESKGVSEEGAPDTLGGGLAHDGGRLYAVSGRGVVAALDAGSGEILWRKNLYVPLRSAPRIADGRLFVISADSQLYALAAEDGEVQWTHRGIAESAGVMNSVSPAVGGGLVIVPYGSGEVYALPAGGGFPLWSESLAYGARTGASASFGGIGGDPVVDGEVVFAVSGNGRMAVFTLLSGQLIWEQPISSLNTPWVAGDFVFVLTADNALACLVKYNGRVRWSAQLPRFEDEEEKTDPILWQGPVLANGKLLLAGSHGKLLLVSAEDGTIADTRDIPEGVVTPPVVAGGKVYLVGKDATLYGLQ